jgi:hypothetical protein
MWRILPGLVGRTGERVASITQGTPLLLPRLHPQLLVIARFKPLKSEWLGL